MALTLWHNPRCSKSRQTLALLDKNDVSPKLRIYMQEPPNEAEIRAVLAKLGGPAIEMMRPKEVAFKEAGLSAQSDEETLIKAMVSNPALIERPILITDTQAAIGRPPEAVFAIL
ncbi:MAG: arsenate reductase [Halocynthiibacter sp.]|jgi:arsenate reductase